MVTLVEQSADFNGKIKILDPIKVQVLNKLPVGIFGLTFSLGIDYGTRQVNNTQNNDVVYRLKPSHCSLSYAGLPLSIGYTSGGEYQPNLSQNITYTFRIGKEELELIEGRRENDIEIFLNPSYSYIATPMNSVQPIGALRYASLPFNWKLSEREWHNLLANLGYGEKWIIEVDRPKIEGFHEVIDHLNKAQDALYNRHEPEDVIRDLRAARDAFKVYFEEKRELIFSSIDKGSPKENSDDPKSKKVEEMYKKISNFLNIGPHNDKYKVSYADAQLAFRQFVSILAYIAPFFTEI